MTITDTDLARWEASVGDDPDDERLLAIRPLCAAVRAAQLDLSLATEQVNAFAAGLAGEPEPRGMTDLGLNAYIVASQARQNYDALRARVAELERERDALRGEVVGLSSMLDEELSDGKRQTEELSTLRAEVDRLRALVGEGRT